MASTIILTLTNDTWVAAGATFNAQRQNIINGLDSAGVEANGWDAVARPAIPVGNVVRTSDTVVTITMPAVPGYNITSTETITATVPASALVTSAVAVVADPVFAIVSLIETAALSGTITNDTELDIRNGGATIVLTLNNVQWEAAVGADNAQTQALIDGIDSAQAEGTGWDAVVKAGLTFANVVRTSDTVVTITLPAFPGYNITANETITATIPASALDFPDAIIATPTFDIIFLAESAAVTGTVTDDDEQDIRDGGSTLVLTLTNVEWEANVGADNAQTQDLINGLDSAQAEGTGWDAVVKAGLTFANVVRTSETVVTITLPAFPGYFISDDETITVTIPASALDLPVSIIASPSFLIVNIPPAAGGSVAFAQRELLLL